MKGSGLTQGRVFPTLMRFAIPYLLANVLQALYGAADLFIVGQFADAAAISAVATGSQVMQTLQGFIVALTTGGTVVIGQLIGAGKKQEAADGIATVCVVFLAAALLFTGGLVWPLRSLCVSLQVPPEAYTQTFTYLLVCSAGIPFIVGYNAVSGVLRGLGDSRTPLYFVAIACALNIGGDLLLVGGYGMGAAGAAIATIAAQGISLVLSLLYLAAKGALAGFRRAHPQARGRLAGRILSVGLPIALQEGLVNISFLIITAIVNRLGVYASAAVGVVEKLIVFSMLPTTAIASAIAAMAAQNIGAGLSHRARACLRDGVGLSLVFGVLCFVLAQAMPQTLVGAFSSDAPVILAGAQYLRSYSLDCILVCFVFCMNSYFTGIGHPVFPLAHSFLTTLLLRLPLSWLLSLAQRAPMFKIGFAAPAATALSLALCVLFLGYLSRKPERFPLRQLARARAGGG